MRLNLLHRAINLLSRKFSSRAATTSTSTTSRKISHVIMPGPDVNILEDFELVMEGRANGVHPVSKWRSRSTGLEVVHAMVPGPIVNGYIVLGK